MCITIQHNVNIKTKHCMKSYLQIYFTLYLYRRWYEELISKAIYYVEQVLKFVRRVSIIASQVVNSVFDKLRYYSWIFVYIVRTARFCVSQITFIWNVHTQRIGNPYKIKIFINKRSKSRIRVFFYVATFQQHLSLEQCLSVDTIFQSLWFLSGFP